MKNEERRKKERRTQSKEQMGKRRREGNESETWKEGSIDGKEGGRQRGEEEIRHE